VLEADAEVDRRDFTVRAALTVAPGERLALFGPSGAGKTTILETIAGLVPPRRARIVLAGRLLTSTAKPTVALPPWQRGVGLLRQDPGLFPHLSVRDNLLYGRAATRSAARSGRTAETGSPVDAGAVAAAEVADLTGILAIDGLLSAMPARLSGGQAHRVALGRLLLAHCDALLLDEPYAGLDASLRRTLTDLVVSLVARRGVPAILVAHELAEAQAFADRLAVLDRGQILQTGAPGQVVLRPAGRRVAELVGYTAFVPVQGPPSDPTPNPPQDSMMDPGQEFAPGAPASGSVGLVAGIHPDRVIRGSHPDKGLVLAGVVTSCRPAGALWEIAVRASGVTVTGRLPEATLTGRELVMTATDPPCFGPDGAAVTTHGPVSRSGQAGVRG
jgi:molybdate transport system ATP-binding protein